MNTLPDNLAAFRHDLEHAIGQAVTRRRRRTGIRIAAGAVVVAAALGAASLVSNGLVKPASADSVVRNAVRAVAAAPGTILHVDIAATQTNADGSTVTWQSESWQSQSAPFDRRQIETNAGDRVETANADGSTELFDPAKNTIYVSPPPAAPHYDAQPGSKPGTFIVTFRVPTKVGGQTVSVTVTAADLAALRAGRSVVELKVYSADGALKVEPVEANGIASVVPTSSAPGAKGGGDQDAQTFRGQILALLHSGGIHVVGRTTIAGRSVIELASPDGDTTYYVDPQTYDPVELDTHGTGGGTRLLFRSYDELPASSSTDLLSLTAQHPSATVDRNPDDYRAAVSRLLPHG